jgi:autotransporter-associated beta strand protein
MKLKTLLFIFSFVNIVWSQNLTISSSGQTGTSGTNWSITGNTLNVASSGSAHINTSVISNHLNNVGNLTVVLPWQSGVIRQCSIDGTITYTGSAARTLTFSIANDILITTANQSITATNGALNVVLRAATSTLGQSPSNGMVSIINNNTINTNGGHLWIGGGDGNTTWNGLTVGNSMARIWADNLAGISIVNSTINTNGGHIYMYGRSHNTSDDIGSSNSGVNIENSSISSTSGSITIYGDVLGRYTNGVGTSIKSSTSATSISTTSGSINIGGWGSDQATNGNGFRFGAIITGFSSTSKTIISSVSGNIQIEGNANFTATINDKEGLGIGGSTEIISRSGNISLRGTNTLESSGQYCNSIRFDASNVANSIRVGFDGTNSYSGNILIEGNSIYQRNQLAGSGSLAIQTTGNLTIQPTGNAFTFMRAGNVGTLTFDNDWNFGTQLSSFTYGKSTNTTDLSYTNELSVAGPITFHSGNFTINKNITSTTASNITINAINHFYTSNNRQTISTSGGNITINADADGNGIGILELDYLTCNPGSGNTIIRGFTMNWITTNNTDKPYINGTGNFTFEPNTASFGQAINTIWFDIDQDNNGIGGLNLGKTTNNQDVVLGHMRTSINHNGPVNIYGKDITISQNLNVTSINTSILIQAIGRIVIDANETIQTNGGNITIRSNSDGSVTSGTAITLNSDVSLLSQGGNLTLGGNFTGAQGPGLYAAGTTNNIGILIQGATLNAAGGNIKIYGKCNGSYNDGIRLRGNFVTTGAGTIELYGEAFGGNNGANYFGGITFGVSSGSTIETENGNIILSGLLTNTQSNNTGAINFYREAGSSGQTRHINLLSKNGNIEISGNAGTTGAFGIGSSSWGDIYVGSPQNGTWAATGDVSFTFNRYELAGLNGFKVKTTGDVAYIPTGASFTAALSFPFNTNHILAENASSLTIGKSGNTSAISIASPISLAAPIDIYGGTIAVNGTLSAINSNLSIETNTALTQTAAINADNLSLTGSGTVTLNNTSNNVVTIAGGSALSRLGSLSYTDALGGLTIGAVGSLNGIHTNTGVVLVETLNGNINLNGSVTTNNTSANALIINAGKSTSIGVNVGGDISVNGTPSISVGTGGIAKLFSGLEINSSGLTTLVGGSNNVRYNFDETTTTYTPALNTNTAHAIYRTSLGTGDLTIVNSGGDTINSTWIYQNGVISTIASLVNINASVLANYLINDTLIIEAGNVTINGAITSSVNNPFVINSNGVKTIAVNASISLGGSATFNSNDFSVDNGINITTSSASDITINTNANIGTLGTTRRNISSAGGNIIIHADKDANGSGVLDLDYLTLNPGVGNIIIRGETATFSTGSAERPYINGTGRFIFEPSDVAFGQDMQTTWFGIDQDANGISGITIGKTGNTANILQNSHLTIAGPVSYYGGNVTVSGSLTLSANGDIFLKGIGSFVTISSTITKTAGTGTLTMQSHGRTNTSNFGTITANGTSRLNIIMWSDFDNTNNDGGSSIVGDISTNGGHVWLGGSNTNGGSYTWNGLTVGDGPSIGSSCCNQNAIDLFCNVYTSGGDFFAWAGNGVGGGTNGIATNATKIIQTMNGDITFIASSTSGAIWLRSAGLITLAPNGGSYTSALTLGGTLNSGNYLINTGFYNGIIIFTVAAVDGLTIGRYTGLLNNGAAVNIGNTSNITVSSDFGLGGSFNLFGSAIALNANITTSNSTIGNININGTSISGTGNLAVATGRTATINISSNSSYDGIISGTGSRLTKTGAGLLTLTKDHTYTGITTISGGDLQVGTGGSLSQASSGTISNTSGVTVASGSKLILSPNENMVFAAPISGAGGVEIKGASGNYYKVFLTGTAATIATNSSVLEVLTRITGGLMDGQQVIGGGSLTAGAYVKSYDAATNSASLQFQQYDGQYTKVVFALLSQSGTNVQIRANTSIYGGAANRSGNHLGVNMATGSVQMGLATTPTGTGYGIAQVYLSGKVNFTGALSYTGNTTLSNTVTNVTSPNTYSYTSRGTQEITNASSSFPSSSTVINNGLVIFNRATPLTISSNMEGTEDVLQVGAPITLTGTCTHSGITTIDLNKSLTIGNGSNLGSITGDIINHGTLTFSRSNNSSYPGIISGSGILVKSGAGTHILSGLNTYSGSTTINAGQLVIERDIPVTSSTGFSGAGELVIQPSSASFTNAINYPLSGFNVSSTIGGLTIGKLGNTANLTVTNNTLANGPITFYSGTITLNDDVTSSNNGNISFFSDNAMNIASQSNINAAGTFSYIPQNNSFASTVTLPITNLKVICKGLWIGKTTNTSSVIFGDTTIIDGPITAFGGSLSINENMRSSNGSNISLYGNSLNIGANKTLSSTGRLILAPQTDSNTIGIAGATGTLQLPSSYFTTNFADGFSYIQIGRSSQTGNISSNGLTLRDSMNFMTSGSLSLGGKIVLGANHVIIDSSVANINVGSPANYFQTNGSGVIKSILGTNKSRLFPIGNTYYNPVTITNKSDSLDEFSTRLIDSVYLNGSSGSLITNPQVRATWDISKIRANSGSGIDFEFSWDVAQERVGINNFVLNHYNGSGWQIAAGTRGNVSGTSTKTITHTGYTGSFSPFAFGSSLTGLPVELIDFNAKCMNDFIQIKWTTASEKNNKMFELYKSENASDWEWIHMESGQGDKASETNYQFMDYKKQAAYYRLKDIDFDGNENWSPIIFADCESNASNTEIYPNPATDYIKVSTEIDNQSIIRIIDFDGREVKTLPLISKQTLVDIKSLVSGVYIFEIINQKSKTTFKINKL